MVGTLIDNIIALIVTGAIFTSAIMVVPTLSYVNLLYVDQQQLRNIALDTLKTMLLEAGYPTNWGTTYNFHSDQVERFGLALAGSSSSYVLDPDKVQRLAVGNPAGFIKYEDIRAKLNLQGYGFSFSIIPPIKVSVNDEDFDGESNPITLEDLVEGIEVSVTDNAGSPIPKALVEATLVYALKDVENVENTLQVVKVNNNTNAVGKFIMKPDIPDNPNEISDFVIVFKVTVADITSVSARTSYMHGFGEQHVVNASLVGDNLTLTIPEGRGWEKDSAGARWVVNAMQVNENEVSEIYNGLLSDGTYSDDAKITWGLGHWGWSMLFGSLSYSNSLFFIFTLSVPNPRRLVLFLGPDPNWRGFRVADCGGTGTAPIATVQRCVTISGMTYLAGLTLWKESP